MIRTSALWTALGAIGLIASVASADPVTKAGPRAYVSTPPSAFTNASERPASVSNILYLERCVGGCTIHVAGTNDARTNKSTIGTPGDHAITEFATNAGLTGVAADSQWAGVVQCMKDVYSPFNVTITDVRPTNGESYTMALIAGHSVELLGSPGGSGILGIAPLAGDCSAQNNVISFSFANDHTFNDPQDRIWNLCWTAAQESAHAYGLDHEYVFDDGTSACNDPMTYRNDCGGEKFFRNQSAKCGEYEARPCKCGGEQNSHLQILGVFGAGTSIIPAPTMSLTLPNSTATTLGAVVSGRAFSKRGVAHADVFLNGFKWGSVPAANFGPNGQAEAAYTYTVPGDVPNGVIDVQMKAYDDLNVEGDSEVRTVTKGSPCVDATSCAAGQKCDAGKCYWDQPTGMVGDACTYDQFCVNMNCQGTADEKICTQTCVPGVGDSCPADSGLTCLEQSPGVGICFPDDGSGGGGGGCCSVGKSDNGWWAHALLGAAVLGFVTRRRRQRA